MPSRTLLARHASSRWRPPAPSACGAVELLATVALSEPNDKLKDGQTGRGTIITQQRANVLSVPNSAIHEQGTTSTVVLLNDDGTQQTVPIEVGAVGSDRTEVLSGLTEGQRVVLPDGAELTSPTATKGSRR